MKAAILTIGEELISGFTVDTNAAWIAQALLPIGIRVVETVSVGDDPEAIIGALERLDNRMGLVIATGGLGPTHDDITKSAFCRYFDSALEFDTVYWDSLVERFASRGVVIPENNRSQAEVPVKAEVLPNSVGSALGLRFRSPQTTFILLPGVPLEMQAIMTEEVLPSLGKKTGDKWITVRTSGIFESALAERLELVLASFPEVKVAFLPEYSGVNIRLWPASAGNKEPGEVESAARAIETELGALAYGRDQASIGKIVVAALTARGETLALAESCTGGLVASLVTDVPGASKVLLGSVVAYSNAVKEQQLGVSPESMRDFGAVSDVVVREMAAGAQAALGGTWGVATTGISGPTGGTPKKPVGLAYIAVSGPGGIVSKEMHLAPIRLPHKAATAQAALNLLRLEILRLEH